jgi:hypothetical protein
MPSSVRYSNPFRYGALALDESFADRDRELSELVSDARNGQDVVILAPRRYGKSSLVWRVAQQLTADDVIVARVDLMATPTKERFAGKLAETVFENVASVLERAREKALAPLRGLRVQPTIAVDPEDGSFRFRFAMSHEPEDIDATLERLLELPGELGGSRGRSVVLVLDEFQEVVGLDPKLPNLMRSVFQRQPEVAHVYLGSKRHVMEAIFNDANEPFWRSAKAMQLGPIAPGEFGPFIADRFRATGRAVDDAALSELLATTGGHPYATQELCYFLWERIEDGGLASAEDLREALAAVMRAEDARFTLLWDELAPGHKLLLEALAAEQPARPMTVAYRRRHQLSTQSAVQSSLRSLGDRELLSQADGEWSISEPFLAEWINGTVGGRGG